MAIAAKVMTGVVCRSYGGTLEPLSEAATMLRADAERCHRIKMNKPEYRELIALRPVYPGVKWLYGSAERRR